VQESKLYTASDASALSLFIFLHSLKQALILMKNLRVLLKTNG